MGLATAQAYLARLYTDRALREGFFADPVGAAAAAGLDPDDAAVLAQLAPAQVRFFARSLQRKRLGEVAKLLPATCAALGERFAPLFFRYAEASIPGGSAKHQADALAFCAYLRELARAGELDPGWIAAVPRYEAAWLTAWNPSCHVQVRAFRHAIPDILTPQGEDARPIEPPLRPTVALWWRPGRGGCVRHVMWSFPRLARRAARQAAPMAATLRSGPTTAPS
jgi:hypothetical protein